MLADQIAAAIETIGRDAERIQPLSRTQPHIFAEQKDAIARRLQAIAAQVRNSFGGTPPRKMPTVKTPAVKTCAATSSHALPGTIAGRRGAAVRVEVRRRAAGC